MKLSKKRLLPSEYERYKLIGKPDLSQNWLEIFTPAIVSDLFTIMHSCSNNQTKAEYIEKEMGYYGFQNVGLGTNIYTMSNPVYPGVIFKFALDDNGLADNFNDVILQDYIPRYARTLARHPSGIVSVQERKVVISDQDRMDTFRPSILKTLRKLSEDFLIVDISPSLYHLNYGIERNGDWCFIDASDLYPLENIKEKLACKKAIGYDDKKHKVKRCGGRLRYNEDFSAIICTKCGAEYLPLEVRPKDKEDKAKMSNAMTDGLSVEEREILRQDEIRAILERNGNKVQASTMYGTTGHTDPSDDDLEDQEDEEMEDPGTEVEQEGPEDEQGDDPDSGDDDDVEVERQRVFEPDAGVVQKARASFEPETRVVPDVIVIEEEDGVQVMDATEQHDEQERPHATYEIEYEDGEPVAIKIVIHGDIMEAMNNSAVSIFVGFDDDECKATTRAISSRGLADILIPIATELREDNVGAISQ